MKSLQIVTADGQVRTCSSSQNSDLFWACRGWGGGNFGVVTSFTFGTHPVGQIVLFFLSWPWSQAARVISAWQSWAPHAPDALWSNMHLSAAPGGSVPSIQVGGTYLGSLSVAAAQLDKLYAAAGSHPSSPFMEYDIRAPRHAGRGGLRQPDREPVPPAHPEPGRQVARASEFAKSDFFTKLLSSHGIGTLLAGVEKLPAGGRRPRLSGGHRVRRARRRGQPGRPGPTAFVHRDALFQAQYTTTWPAGSAAAAVARRRRCSPSGSPCARTPAARPTRTTSTRR